MSSSIDPTKPTSGRAYTEDVRNNFNIARQEISALQSGLEARETNLPLRSDFSSDAYHESAAAAAGAQLLASQSRFKQSGPGATERTVEQELRDRRNLKQVGLDEGNSAAENDAALLEAATRGGSWFMPEGRYAISHIPARPGFIIQGDGFGKSIFLAENAGGTELIYGPHRTTTGVVADAAQVRGFGLYDLEIDGSGAAGNCLDMPGISRSAFRVYIHGFATGYGVRFASPEGTHNVGTYYNSFFGTIIRENQTNVLFEDGDFDAGNTNFFFGGQINAPVAGGKCIDIDGSPTNVGFFGVAIESAAAGTYLLHHKGTSSLGIVFPGSRFEEGVAANGIVLDTGSAGVDLRMAVVSGSVTITNNGTNHVERTPGQHSGVPIKVTRSSGTDQAFATQVSGESLARLEVRANGTLIWSSGSVQDTNLYRESANLLKTDDSLFISHNLRLNHSSPAQFTANTNNWTPSSNADMSVFRIFSNGAIDLTGMTGGVQGRIGRFYNVGAQTITIKHQDTNSTDINRFICHTGADIAITAGGTLGFWYDDVTDRWRTHP